MLDNKLNPQVQLPVSGMHVIDETASQDAAQACMILLSRTMGRQGHVRQRGLVAPSGLWTERSQARR